MTDIFERLESNDREIVETAKQNFREQFLKTSDPWLLNGLYDYYLNTNSERAMEILVTIKEPHFKYLFDKLSDSLKGSMIEIKVKSLTMLGYIARSQPTWIYKLKDHNLLKDMLSLLKNEVELLPLISALLVLIVLLPMIPSAMGNHLRDIFDIFSRLASWNCSPGKIVEDQLIHMQVALYALFLRLYGMYPCNFLEYLRDQYKDKHKPVFVHTVKPMLDTVRMNPSLVTASTDTEITTERWKKMGAHEVIVECERFSLDLTDRCPHDSCQYASGIRSRSGTTNSTIESAYQLQNVKSLASSIQSMPSINNSNNYENTANFFTPSRMFHVQTPPISESVPTNIPQIQGIVSSFPSHEGSSPPEAAIEATPETTPVRVAEASTAPASAVVDIPTLKNLPAPTSPLRIINPERQLFNTITNQRIESPVSREDEEVLSIVSKSQNTIKTAGDYFMQEFDLEKDIEHSDEKVQEEMEKGSPCTAGGLHMPNSKSMNNFAKRVQRLRHHSQCNPEPERMEISTGSSPGNGVHFSSSTTVRRAVSCPEMKKSPNASNSKDNKTKTLNETDEETSTPSINDCKKASSCVSTNGLEPLKIPRASSCCKSRMTQTENFYPYEILFLGVFPSLETNYVRPSPAPSPSPFNSPQEKEFPPSIYDILDRYIEAAVQSNDRNAAPLKEQLQLLHQHLLFERHRRETHAYRNRRLLSDAKSTRVSEEYNSALRDTVQLKEKDLEALRNQLEEFKAAKQDEEEKLNRTIQYWQNQYKTLQTEYQTLRESNDMVVKELTDVRNKCAITDRELKKAQEELLDAIAEVNVARQQAQAGERGRKELEQVNKELVLIGELQLKYQERLDKLDANREISAELEQVKEAYKEEIIAQKHVCEAKEVALEAYRARVGELERLIANKEDLLLVQKKNLADINEQRFEKLEAVESKYQTQLTINRALEEKILDLRQRWVEAGRRGINNSPDTSSCHEVNVTTTAGGFSPHSSPLSASLASSEGSIAFHDREVKNLQALVDQKDVQPSSSKSRLDDAGGGPSDCPADLEELQQHQQQSLASSPS